MSSGNLAIIPVRTGSKRLPGKNMLMLDGRPLFIHAVEQAVESGVFDEIHVSTESDEVRRMCASAGIDVPFQRDAELASDTAKLLDVMKFVVRRYEQAGRKFENICVLWATNPLRTADDICESLALLGADTHAVVGACEFEHPIYCAQEADGNGFLAPMFPDKLWLPSSSMPRALVDNGTLVWCRIASLFEYDSWMPPRTRPYIMPRSRSIEIETDDDWKLAQAQYQISKVRARESGGRDV